MALLDLIEQRRSVRRFSPRPVPGEEMRLCLEAARLAPSACNSQPWHFIVIDEPELRARVAGRIFSGAYAMNAFAKEAPVLVAVVTEKMKFLAAFGSQVRDTRYALVDIGIACEHFVLQAQERGIGTCWIGWFDEKALKKVLKIPQNKRIDIVIACGYPQESKTVPKARKPLEAVSSRNGYFPSTPNAAG
ncbi:MAG: nitroreductase family protein [Candidatus Omnitrophica bacterium]|nr:nitroreductase family protein [Candidatus Omnitrophota bacterium]